MCDVCKAKGHIPIYTLSYLTGERLVLCLDCADATAEPITSVIHGVNGGALDNLDRSVKRQLKVFYQGEYIGLRECALMLAARVKALPAPADEDDDYPSDPELSEEVMATFLVRKMIEASKTPFDPLTAPRPSSSILRRSLLVIGRLARSAYSGILARVEAFLSTPHRQPVAH